VGEVKVTLKIQGFSWYWIFLVSKRLQGPRILGVDFISRTNLVLDLVVRDVIFVLLQRCIFLLSAVQVV